MITLMPHPANRASCSCMIIVRDAEDTIFKCLDSLFLARCFDQIIIIQDTRTKDRTPGIIAHMQTSHPEITYEWHKWVNYDFSAARNKALTYVKCKYGFWMDSDDMLIDGYGVRELLKNPGGNAYKFKVICPGPDWTNETVVEHLRLFPIIPGLKWELPVHEQIAFKLREARIPEVQTPYRILHTGYLKGIDVQNKHERNFRIMEKWLKENPEDSQMRRYLNERYQESLKYINYVKSKKTA